MSSKPAAPPLPPNVANFLLDPIPRIIPAGGISLLAGAPNVGKTALLAGLVRNLRDQRPVFGHAVNKVMGIGLIAADRGWERGAGEWFQRAGYSEILHYSMVDDVKFDPRTLRRKFERPLRLLEMIDKLQLPKHSLVLVDPIGLFLGGNLNDYDSCAVACHEIRTMLRDRCLTILGTAHSAKLKADKRERYLRLQDQLLGSTAIAGFADTQMYLASPEEIGKTYYAFLWHPHTAPAETFFLERDEQGLYVPYSGADEGNCTRVLAFLPEDGSEISAASWYELAEAIPISKATFKRVVETLIERERVRKVKHGIYSRVLTH
jgi:hypothetical protein